MDTWLASWREAERVSPVRPLRFVEAPGPALLRQNLSWLRTLPDPSHDELARVARAAPASIYALFDLPCLVPALEGCRRLAASGLAPVAVRGRAVPAESVETFRTLWLGEGLLPLLQLAERALPERWTHPVVFAEAHREGGAPAAYGVVFSRLPEPGLLDFEDEASEDRAEPSPPPDCMRPMAKAPTATMSQMPLTR